VRKIDARDYKTERKAKEQYEKLHAEYRVRCTNGWLACGGNFAGAIFALQNKTNTLTGEASRIEKKLADRCDVISVAGSVNVTDIKTDIEGIKSELKDLKDKMEPFQLSAVGSEEEEEDAGNPLVDDEAEEAGSSDSDPGSSVN